MNNYQLHEVLSSGRHGSVYWGTNNVRRSLHAIKRLPLSRHDMPTFRNVAMIKNETKHLKMLRDANRIVHLDEAIQTDHGGEEVVLLVTELCSGGSLDNIMQLQSMQSMQSMHSYTQKAVLVRQILQALKACHDQGIMHGDLKPANIMFKTQPLSQNFQNSVDIKLIDFGSSIQCSAYYGAAVTHMTPFYMAPEVAQACGSVGFAADMWAFGVVMYQLMNARGSDVHPFVSGLRHGHGHGNNTNTGLSFDVNSMLMAYHKKTQVALDIQDVVFESDRERRAYAILSDVLKMCLVYDPKERISAEEALQRVDELFGFPFM